MRRLVAIASIRCLAVSVLGASWILIGWQMSFLHPLSATLGLGMPAWARLPGIVAVAVGAALVLISGALRSTRGTGPLAGAEGYRPRDFVTTGPFRLVRNPESLGGVLLLAGIALWYRSALGLGFAAAFFLVVHLVVVYMEEPALEKRYGENYRDYRRQVPRWLPRVPSRQ